MKSTNYGHEQLRVPVGWENQDKALIIQLNRILDDIYNKIGMILENMKALAAEAAEGDAGNGGENI